MPVQHTEPIMNARMRHCLALEVARQGLRRPVSSVEFIALHPAQRVISQEGSERVISRGPDTQETCSSSVGDLRKGSQKVLLKFGLE